MEPRPGTGFGAPRNQAHGGETAGAQRALAQPASQGSSGAALDKDVKSLSGIQPGHSEDLPSTVSGRPGAAASSGYQGASLLLALYHNIHPAPAARPGRVRVSLSYHSLLQLLVKLTRALQEMGGTLGALATS